MEDPHKYRNNAFSKHILEYHDGDRRGAKFKMDVICSYKKPLERQVREGVEIYRTKADVIMNSKLDHFQPGVTRIGFENILDE